MMIIIIMSCTQLYHIEACQMPNTSHLPWTSLDPPLSLSLDKSPGWLNFRPFDYSTWVGLDIVGSMVSGLSGIKNCCNHMRFVQWNERNMSKRHHNIAYGSRPFIQLPKKKFRSGSSNSTQHSLVLCTPMSNYRHEWVIRAKWMY